MYVRNGILYDNNGDACVEKDMVRVVLDDGSIIEDIITWIGEDQDKGFEDNDIYFKNRGIVPLYNMKEAYKIFDDKESDKTEIYLIIAYAEDTTECEIELDKNQLSTIISVFKKMDENRSSDYCPWYIIEDNDGNVLYKTEPI